MELTKKQQDGLEIALERYRAGEKYTVIAGYAGLKTHLDKTCETNFYFFE